VVSNWGGASPALVFLCGRVGVLRQSRKIGTIELSLIVVRWILERGKLWKNLERRTKQSRES
jgi:hypothetical protein